MRITEDNDLILLNVTKEEFMVLVDAISEFKNKYEDSRTFTFDMMRKDILDFAIMKLKQNENKQRNAVQYFRATNEI